MSWTEERVELLTKLWTDGLSAATIARELGMSVTRNAVIGKVHRIGLGNRPKTTNQMPTQSDEIDEAAPAAHIFPNTSGESIISTMSDIPVINTPPDLPMVNGNNALALHLAPMVATAAVVALVPRPQPLLKVVIPTTERVTIMELRESMCKWPLGDPMQADFRYCGARAPIGGAPYCTTHANLAYQPAQDRRRSGDRKQLRIG